MKSEDTRNLFLAIALSVLVMAAWQYFYAGPLYQREHQAQMEANQANTAAPNEAQPTGAQTALPPGAPAAATPPGRADKGGPRDCQSGPGGQPPYCHRYAERRRLDRS